MATKAHRRQAKLLLEGLENRMHVGPPLQEAELRSAQDFLRAHDFSHASDYFQRLGRLRSGLLKRWAPAGPPPTKRNYGGKADGHWVQLQSVYDHVLLSTCYEGEFNRARGRVKLSHRLNAAGRVDFVELKFLRALRPFLNGEIRKLLVVKDYSSRRKDWWAAEAFVLPILPQELLFVEPDIFRCSRPELFSGLINMGRWLAVELVRHLPPGSAKSRYAEAEGATTQSPLEAVRVDEVAWPILEQAAALEAAVEATSPNSLVVRYCLGEPGPGLPPAQLSEPVVADLRT